MTEDPSRVPLHHDTLTPPRLVLLLLLIPVSSSSPAFLPSFLPNSFHHRRIVSDLQFGDSIHTTRVSRTSRCKEGFGRILIRWIRDSQVFEKKVCNVDDETSVSRADAMQSSFLYWMIEFRQSSTPLYVNSTQSYCLSIVYHRPTSRRDNDPIF